jgi:hypothetical protein
MNLYQTTRRKIKKRGLFRATTVKTWNPTKPLLELRGEESESELLYDWRFTANQFDLSTNPLRLTTSKFIFQLNTYGHIPYLTSSLTRRLVCRLQFLLVLLASAVILKSSPVGLMTTFTVSYSRVPQPEGLGRSIYTLQEDGDPVILSGTVFSFRRLLRLAGLRWIYSNPVPHVKSFRR